MSINIRRQAPLTSEEELESEANLAKIRERIMSIKPAAANQSKSKENIFVVPEMSYWPFIKAALDKGDDQFDMVVDSLFDGTFELPPETPEEYEARMKQLRKVCFKY
jgi:hypothetical protein